MRSLLFTALLAGAAVFAGAPARADGDASTGQKLFAQRCAFCHSIDAAERKLLGPHLAAVVGRKAASVADFKYSPAFADLSVVWADKTLDEFLAAPAQLAPGTVMVVGVPQLEDREDLIAYLKTLK